MLSFDETYGKPVASIKNIGRSGIPDILHVVDPDTIPKCKSGKCQTPKKTKCCRYCGEGCAYELCCNKCCMYPTKKRGGKYSSSDYDSYASDSFGSDSYVSDESESEELPSIRMRKTVQKKTVSKPQNKIIGTKLEINKEKQILSPLPDVDSRFVSYISGPSGSGKSTYASNIATTFKKVFPHKPVYLFSRTDHHKDPALVKLRPIQIGIDENLLQHPIDISQEISGGALIIFDDCNTVQDAKLKKEIDKLMCDIMEIGRKLDCSIIITNHLVLPNEKSFARTLMNEIHNMTVFPKSGSSHQITYALKTYFGLKRQDIEKIIDLPSRWVTISTHAPRYVLHQGGCYIL